MARMELEHVITGLERPEIILISKRVCSRIHLPLLVISIGCGAKIWGHTLQLQSALDRRKDALLCFFRDDYA
jgi:hypothetical protein